MHEVLVNRLGGLNLPRKSVVRLTDRPDMTLDVYRGRKTTNQQIIVSIKQMFVKNSLSILVFVIDYVKISYNQPGLEPGLLGERRTLYQHNDLDTDKVVKASHPTIPSRSNL